MEKYDASHQQRQYLSGPSTEDQDAKQSWHVNTTVCEIPLGKNGRSVQAYCPASDITLAGEYVKDTFMFAMAIIEPCYAYEDELLP